MIDPDLLKYYREQKKLSIRELSNKIRIAKSKIKMWEEGALEPTEKELDYLLKFYKINKEDLMYMEENNNRRNIIVSIILGVIGITIGGLINNIAISILLAITLITIYFLLLKIRKYYQLTKNTKESIPKSLFALMLNPDSRKQRMSIYIIESSFISSIYILFNIICRILDLDNLVINIKILESKQLNMVILLIIIFLLLSLLSFLIEYIFGEIIVKKYKGEC